MLYNRGKGEEIEMGDERRAVVYRDRIVGHGFESPESLLANPMNFRIHPREQREVLGEVLEAIGWIQEVVVNRVTGNMVDGHLRVLLAMERGEEAVPVEYVEISEEEERLMLAVYDKLSAMAAVDDVKLSELLAQVSEEMDVEAPGLEALLAEMLADAGGVDGEGELGEFGNFEEEGSDGQYIDFRFGNYKGKVSRPVYESFEGRYREVRHEHAEYAVLDDILREWLGV